MNQIFYLLLAIICLASCTDSYNIEGTSNVSSLDGRKLYLKVVKADSLQAIDSCDVVHGQFTFQGPIDSVRVGQIFMDDENLGMPVVLEKGNITVRLDNVQQSVSGTPLNEQLNGFWKQFNQIRNEYGELDHEESAAILNGQDESTVNARLIKKALGVYAKGDRLFTKYIVDNFDNVLGPWIFITRISYDTTPNAYPIWMDEYMYANAINQLPSWVEYIMSKATDQFKNNPDIKAFYSNFIQSQKEMNGTAESSNPVPAMGADPTIAPPTPNEMAGDSTNTNQ